MDKILKQLLLKEKFEATNVVAVIEMLEESNSYIAPHVADLLLNGCPKYKLNHDKIQEATKDYYAKYRKDAEITKFTKTTINPLENRIRVFFNKKDSTYEDYHDLYNIEDYCND